MRPARPRPVAPRWPLLATALVSLSACIPPPKSTPSAPDAALDAALPNFRYPNSIDLYRPLQRPLPVEARSEEACTLRITQATLLARREVLPEALQLSERALAECHSYLAQLWLARAESARREPKYYVDHDRSLPQTCRNARTQIEQLLRHDEAQARGYQRDYERWCEPAAVAEAEARLLEGPPKYKGAGDRVQPTCDRRAQDGTCEIPSLQSGEAHARAQCERTQGVFSAQPCPTEQLVGACSMPDDRTWFSYREGPTPFNNLKARQACEALEASFTHASQLKLPEPPPVDPPAPSPEAAGQ